MKLVALKWGSSVVSGRPASWTGLLYALPRRRFGFPKMGILIDHSIIIIIVILNRLHLSRITTGGGVAS